MDKKSLQDKLKSAEGQFNGLKEQETKLLGEAKELNQKLAKVREEMIRVQGDYRTINGLIGELKKDSS